MPYRNPEDKNRALCARARKWREEGRCIACGKPWVGDTVTCSACLQRRRGSYQRLRQEIFAAYGGARCRCCGETQLEFLTLDHVNGGGEAHRRRVEGRGSGKNFYYHLRALGFPQDPPLQVLCFNCNGAKGGHGQCPHERKI